jgi:DNA-binding beta-propeller fold protein YncE
VFESANSRILVADQIRGVIAVDQFSGDRVVLSNPRADYGNNGSSVTGIASDFAQNRVLVSDSRVDVIFAIDNTTGARTVLFSSDTASGDPITTLEFGRGLELDRNHDRLLFTSANSLSVTAIDLAKGNRSIFLDIGNTPGNIVVDESADRAAFNEGTTLSELDLENGDRTYISHAGIGSGPNFTNIQNIAVDFANNRAYVFNSSVLLSVAIDSGDRSVLSDAATGTGPMWTNPAGFAIDTSSGIGYVADTGTTAIYTVDLTTGDRAVLSDNVGIGTGPVFGNTYDLVLDTASGRLLVADIGAFGAVSGLKSVDLNTGDRSLLLDSSATFELTPWELALDTANNRLFVYSGGLSGVYVIELLSGEWAVMSK